MNEENVLDGRQHIQKVHPSRGFQLEPINELECSVEQIGKRQASFCL